MSNANLPFDPPGVRWSPVSSRFVTKRLVDLGFSAVVLVAVTGALGIFVGHPTGWIPLAVVVVAHLWLAWFITRQVRAIGYAERDDDLLVRSGIMFRSLVVVPYGRMQYVDVEAGPLDRAFKLARVQLHTASAATDASIPGLPPDEAARLRDRLAARGQSRLAGL